MSRNKIVQFVSTLRSFLFIESQISITETLPDDLIRFIFIFAFDKYTAELKEFCFSSKKVYRIMRQFLAAQVERFRLNPLITLTYENDFKDLKASELIPHIKFSYGNQNRISVLEYFLKSTLFPKKPDPQLYRMSLDLLFQFQQKSELYQILSKESGVDGRKLVIAIFVELFAIKFHEIEVLKLYYTYFTPHYDIFYYLYFNVTSEMQRDLIPESADERARIIRSFRLIEVKLFFKSVVFSAVIFGIMFLIMDFFCGLKHYDISEIISPSLCVLYRVIISELTKPAIFRNSFPQALLQFLLRL